MTLRIPIDCTCGARPTPPPAGDILPDPVHSAQCLITAANTPHAMVNEGREVFYPDSPEDALMFALDHQADFLHSDFRWSEVDDPAPTTGVPLGDYFMLPEGCRCYYREDIDWGDVRTAPEGGCPVHTLLGVDAAAPDRCWSCDHLTTDFHGPEGCRYAVTLGTPDANLVCPCTMAAAGDTTAQKPCTVPACPPQQTVALGAHRLTCRSGTCRGCAHPRVGGRP